MTNEHIDHGKAFDWGRTSADYAAYRDIYPDDLYQKLGAMGVGVTGQAVLDIGTGTGVLPRHLYPYGAAFTGIDRSENQIAQAVKLAQAAGMDIRFQCAPAETCAFPDASFDVVTACQCFVYFDHATLAPHIHSLLKPDGAFVVIYMAWLPFEDAIAGKSEEMILQYNPTWTGGREQRHAIAIPGDYDPYFTVESQDLFDVSIPFDRESWHGRIKTCRGIRASLSEEDIARFDADHRKRMEAIAPPTFTVLHYVAITTLRKR